VKRVKRVKRVILNLTQHSATPEQQSQGVVEPSAELKQKIKQLLTFEELPEYSDIMERAEKLVDLIEDEYLPDLEKRGVIQVSSEGQADFEVEGVLIGGAPYLMAPLEEELIEAGFVPLYAFAKRVVEERQEPDGTVKKITVFRHQGFIRV